MSPVRPIDHGIRWWQYRPMRSYFLPLAFAASEMLACWSGGSRTAQPPKLTCLGDTENLPPVGTVTTCSGGQAPLPALGDLHETTELPDPFLSLGCMRITSADQWACRRTEIAAQAQTYELGAKPPAPASVTGAFDAGNLTVTVVDGGK